jgi:hypothetical protein
VQRSAGRRTGAAFTALPETRPKQEKIDDAENSNRASLAMLSAAAAADLPRKEPPPPAPPVGKAPIGKYPVGKYPIGKYPTARRDQGLTVTNNTSFAKLYDRKMPITAADLLNDRVLPFFEEHDIKLLRVLTDRGSEFCGNPERHEYELYLTVEDIDHGCRRLPPSLALT